MTEAVSYVCDEIKIFTFLASEKAINGIYYDLDDVNVLPLVESTDVVGLSDSTVMEDGVNGTSMIHYIEPVAHVLALTIHRQRLAVADIVDEERNQLLRELVGTIVVRAVGYDSRHSVCVVEGTHEVV